MAIIPKNLNSFPRVQATVDLTGQNATIGTTTAFTPLYNGLYRISVYMYTSVVGGGTVDHTIRWKDSTTSKAQGYGAILLSANAFAQDTTVVFCTAGNNISYEYKVTGLSGGATFDFHLTVELLSIVTG